MKKNLLSIQIASLLFILTASYFIWLQIVYIKESEDMFLDSTKFHLNTLIANKKDNTLTIAKLIASNQELKEILHNKDYKKIESFNFEKITNTKDKYKNIWIQILDNEGTSRYRSWTSKRDDSLLEVRAGLKEFYKHPKELMNLSVGKFDFTFKGIVPIYYENILVGVVDIVTHFNSIVKLLEDDGIQSVVVVNKKYTKQITNPFTETFIQGHYIANKSVSDEIKEIIKKYGIDKFINNKGYIREGGYHIVSIPIYDTLDVEHNYLLFIKNKYLDNTVSTKNKLLMALILITFIFFYLIWMIILKYQENEEYSNLLEESNRDLDEKIRVETEKNLELLEKDALTGSYKKMKFDQDKNKYINQYVVMLNIKNFRYINTLYGFKVGDNILQKVVDKLNTLITSKLYRVNADEFLFFSKNYEEDIQNITDYFSHNPVENDKRDLILHLSFSFGVCTNDGEDLLRKIATAIKEAKNNPSLKYFFYRNIPVQYKDHIFYNNLIFEALKNDYIVPYFQGVRDNKTGEMIKYEALVRIDNGEKVYTPYFFLEATKVGGFLIKLTKTMVDKSFAYLSTLDEKITMSINITEQDLEANYLKNYLLTKLNEYNLTSNRIILEVLEGVSSSGAKNNIKQLKELKAEGFQLALDDFGVEYSNFERIVELDIDYIKIDGKYIKSLCSDEKSLKVVESIASFAKSMEISVIAEFVENEEIQNKIDKLGIEYSQGYLYSIPNKDIL